MFNSIGITRGLSLTKIIGGISKTLQIANQMIPLYQKAKPMIQNARGIMNLMKDFGKNAKKVLNEQEEKQIPQSKTKPIEMKKEENTSPTFFL